MAPYVGPNDRGVRQALNDHMGPAEQSFSWAIGRVGVASAVPFWNAAIIELHKTGLSESTYELMTQASARGMNAATDFLNAWNENGLGVQALETENYSVAAVHFQNALNLTPFRMALYHWNLGIAFINMPGRESDGRGHIQAASNFGYAPAQEFLNPPSGGDTNWEEIGKFMVDVAQFFFGG